MKQLTHKFEPIAHNGWSTSTSQQWVVQQEVYVGQLNSKYLQEELQKLLGYHIYLNKLNS